MGEVQEYQVNIKIKQYNLILAVIRRSSSNEHEVFVGKTQVTC